VGSKEVTATEAARNLGDLLARVRYRGESFLIRRGKVVVAQLGPAPLSGPSGAELAEWWRGHARLATGEANALGRDVAAARKLLNLPPKSPWPR
jgi:antitoxin (DNA-binding transcriptional repressor) of toxin-antitoxin stability system